MQLLAQRRPKTVSESVHKSAIAVSLRRQVWGVDGVWSYDFSKLGYACESSRAETELSVTSAQVHGDSRSGGVAGASASRCVLKASLQRVLRAGGAAFRVLDLGAGSGGWLLQAKKELEERLTQGTNISPEDNCCLGFGAAEGGGRRGPGRRSALPRHTRSMPGAPSRRRGSRGSGVCFPQPVIHLHGVTGGADSFAVPSGVTGGVFEVAHFQQVGFELFPPRLGEAINLREQRALFARTVQLALAACDGESSGKPGYDLIVSSWTFCHLSDQLGTLEMWSDALAVEGELYVNDIDFWVLFEGESAGAVPLSGKEDVEDSTGAAAAPPWREPQDSDVDVAHEVGDFFWKFDTEGRMKRTFELLNTKGMQDGAFSIEFVTDEHSRTAVRVKRLTSAPIRFFPVVGYCVDDGEHPMYRVSDVWSEVDSTVAGLG
mmetsp:Transcript_11904/g.32183  ORF Transcript_11904/g.32183 Transcript_11904/m.32183 type:complete len:432 (-) Transcript_11904:92-1387(-)